MATDFQLGCPIGNLALEVTNTHPEVRSRIEENFEAWRQAVAELIRQAGDRVPERIDPDALAAHVLATMEGAVMLARAYRSFTPFDQAVNQLKDYFECLTAEKRQ